MGFFHLCNWRYSNVKSGKIWVRGQQTVLAHVLWWRVRTPSSHEVFRALTSFTPAPCRQHPGLLVVMWSSADVLEDESSPWLSRSLSLSSMEANTALSIQTDTQQSTEHGLLRHPLSVPGRPTESTCRCLPPPVGYLRCYPAPGPPGSCCCSIHCLL